MAGEGRVLRDYYEVLNVATDADNDEIRRAYKKAALRCHPDKNHGRIHEAELEFKEVQNAYAVLIDEKERAWYDAHKDAILRGDNDGTSAPDEQNLYDYFNPKCYAGYSDGPKGFFTVYRKVFETVVEEELRDSESTTKADKSSYPMFGDSASPYYEVVANFYAYWSSFSTRKSFAWKDEYKAHEMPDRRQRRAAEQYNMKERLKAKREYSTLVQELAAYIHRRDPRVRAEEERKAAEEEAKEEKRLKEAIAADKRRRARDRALWEEVAAEEALREAEEEERLAELAARGELEAQYGVDEQFEKYRQAELERKEAERAEEERLKSEEHSCDVCGGTFKGAAAWAAHQNSKKHKANLRTNKKTQQANEEAQPSENGSTAQPVQQTELTHASPPPRTQAEGQKSPSLSSTAPSEDPKPKPKKGGKANKKAEMAAKQAKAREQLKAKPLAPVESSSSDSDDSSSDDGPVQPTFSTGGFAALGKKKKR